MATRTLLALEGGLAKEPDLWADLWRVFEPFRMDGFEVGGIGGMVDGGMGKFLIADIVEWAWEGGMGGGATGPTVGGALMLTRSAFEKIG